VSDEKKESGSGLSLQTLLISSVSAVAATLIVSQFWEQGTLFFTAMVPIAVALVSEALKRPAQKITQVAPLVAPRRTPTGTAVYDEAPGERPVPEEARRDDPFGLYEEDKRRIDTRRWVRVGLITGLIAFLVGAATVTASELALFDGSVGGGERRTTIFGGKAKDAQRDGDSRDRQERDATPTPEAGQSDGDAAQDTPEATPTPTPEATAPPAATSTPTPQATPPPATTPAPEEPDPAAP
jgi:hypothetical protein